MSLILYKESSKNNSINLSYPRSDGIVPFTMEGVWPKRECRHLFVGHLASGRIGMGIELALHPPPDPPQSWSQRSPSGSRHTTSAACRGRSGSTSKREAPQSVSI